MTQFQKAFGTRCEILQTAFYFRLNMQIDQTVYLTRKVETFGATYQYGEAFTIDQIDPVNGILYLKKEDAAGHRCRIGGVEESYVQTREPLKWDSDLWD